MNDATDVFNEIVYYAQKIFFYVNWGKSKQRIRS